MHVISVQSSTDATTDFFFEIEFSNSPELMRTDYEGGPKSFVYKRTGRNKTETARDKGRISSAAQTQRAFKDVPHFLLFVRYFTCVNGPMLKKLSSRYYLSREDCIRSNPFETCCFFFETSFLDQFFCNIFFGPVFFETSFLDQFF